MNQLRELEFELLVAGLLSAHPDYSYIRTEPRISRSLRPDLTAVRQRDRMTERLVIEAKNYKDPITKTQALQVANYLKPHGAGTLAIVAARKGADRTSLMKFEVDLFLQRLRYRLVIEHLFLPTCTVKECVHFRK